MTLCALLAAANLVGAFPLEGPFPLLLTPWTEDAHVDIPTLIKEAEYVEAAGAGGMIWPTASERKEIVDAGDYETALDALVARSVEKGRAFKARVTAIVSGTNTAQGVEQAAAVERLARKHDARLAILARPADDCTNQVMILDYYNALAKATSQEVIIQTFNGKSPQPSVETIVTLAREHSIYGYVKEESPGLQVNGRMEQLLRHREIKGVFSGWGGKGWVYQGARIGTCGVISQRAEYAPLLVKIWNRIKAGADASDPELARAYASYLYMTNLGEIFSTWGDDEMRGPHLYVLQRLGIFKNRLSRKNGKAVEFKMSDKEKAEVDARLEYIGRELAHVAAQVPDVRVGPRLRDVRLGGAPGRKLDAFIRARMTSSFAQNEIFGEARRAFERRDDDEAVSVGGRRVGGWWRGEFWGKLMLGTARVADYLQDESLLRFVREESHRMVDLADEDGYLGSYGDKENVCISPEDSPAVRKSYGWNSNWNVWNRKYAMWGLLAAYRATGDRTLLASVERQMDQLIDMLHRTKTPLFACGQPEKVGLPPMSILKPLLLLYEETGKRRYLDFAEETIRDWDRDDGACPNFFRNAGRSDPISTWYPKCTQWAKTYEMLSCLDGILEHYRVTGSRRSLEIVRSIRDNIAENEANGIGGVGYCDQLHKAATRINAISEVCDAVHWIRLNLDLYMITGEDRYLDAMETCYLNNFLAGVFRDGSWCAFAVRGCTRHSVGRQCGYAYNHCCVNNAARTWMDMASAGVTKDGQGTYHVNFYEDSTVRFGDLLFEISGNYPVGSNVTVRISGGDPKVVFRKPGWCQKMDVARDGGAYSLTFDMNPRIVHRALAHDAEGADRKNWLFTRYMVGSKSGDAVSRGYRTTPAAEVMWGPLVLARSVHVGSLSAGLADEPSVNGREYSIKAEPVPSSCTWGAWNLELSGPDGDIRRFRACDYQSAGDCPYDNGADVFSIWF